MWGGAAGDALAVELEDEAEGGVGGGVLWPEVEDPAVAGVDVVVEVVDVVRVGRDALVGLEGVRHGRLRVGVEGDHRGGGDGPATGGKGVGRPLHAQFRPAKPRKPAMGWPFTPERGISQSNPCFRGVFG